MIDLRPVRNSPSGQFLTGRIVAPTSKSRLELSADSTDRGARGGTHVHVALKLQSVARAVAGIWRYLALAVLSAAAVTGWVISANNRNPPTAAATPEPKQTSDAPQPVIQTPAPNGVEQVEVWVAAKDLPVGTIFTKAELTMLAVKKSLRKDGLPASVRCERGRVVRQAARAEFTRTRLSVPARWWRRNSLPARRPGPGVGAVFVTERIVRNAGNKSGYPCHGPAWE